MVSTAHQTREEKEVLRLSSVLIDFCIVPISWWILRWSVPQIIIPHYLLVNVRSVQWWVSSIDVGQNHPLVIFCQKIIFFTFLLHWLLLWTSFHDIFFIITGRRKWTRSAHSWFPVDYFRHVYLLHIPIPMVQTCTKMYFCLLKCNACSLKQPVNTHMPNTYSLAHHLSSTQLNDHFGLIVWLIDS